MDPPAIPTGAQLFEKHNLEFRTITTLLHKLGSHERVALNNFHLSHYQHYRHYLSVSTRFSLSCQTFKARYDHVRCVGILQILEHGPRFI